MSAFRDISSYLEGGVGRMSTLLYRRFCGGSAKKRENRGFCLFRKVAVQGGIRAL